MKQLNRFLRSLTFAWSGIRVAIRDEQNLQIHLFVLALVIAAGLVFNINLWEWVAIVLAAALVIAAELMNSAIEKVVDLASPEFHPLAKQAKDIAAGAVLVTACFSAIVGLLIFGNYLLQFLSDYL